MYHRMVVCIFTILSRDLLKLKSRTMLKYHMLIHKICKFFVSLTPVQSGKIPGGTLARNSCDSLKTYDSF
jgi:hypothetical protein